MEGNAFGNLAVDYACKETINKDTQTAGDAKGFSLKAGAVSKYFFVAEYRSIFLRLIKDILDLNKSNFHHTDLQSTRIVRDETEVKSLVEMKVIGLIHSVAFRKIWYVFLLEKWPHQIYSKICLLLKLLGRRHMKRAFV